MASFDLTFDSLRHKFKGQKQPISPVTLGAINKDDSFCYVKGFGKEPGDHVKSDDLYWLASSTKLVTTIAVMQCVERGQIGLNDDIATMLPEWRDPKVLTGFKEDNEASLRPASKAITLRHLLTHSSGMSYYFMNPLMARHQEQYVVAPSNPRSVAEKFPQQFLASDPAQSQQVERLTSTKLSEYTQRHIFDIVSANSATFHPAQSRKAQNWERVGETVQEQKQAYWPEKVEADFGGGGIFATVDDLLKIYQGLLSGKLLRQETVEQMFKPQLETLRGLDDPAEYSLGSRNAIWNSVPDEVPVSFGLGGLLNTAAVPKRRGVNSLTWAGMPNIYWWIDINNGVAGVYLSQLVPSGYAKAVELLAEFEEFVYSSLMTS